MIEELLVWLVDVFGLADAPSSSTVRRDAYVSHGHEEVTWCGVTCSHCRVETNESTVHNFESLEQTCLAHTSCRCPLSREADVHLELASARLQPH